MMGRRLDRALRLALCAPLVAALVIHGSTKRATVSFPPTEAGVAYLVDRGSYVADDHVHLDWVRRIVPDDADLVVERRPLASTNAQEWAAFVTSAFADFAVPTNLPCAAATGWNWQVWADWTPPPSVLTNGVLHANWGRSLNDAEERGRGIAVGIPVQATVWLNADMVGTPGGTNSLHAAAEASAPETTRQETSQ